MVEGNLDREGDGVYDKMRGVGAHEVLVETPDHNKTFSNLTEGEIEGVLEGYRARIVDLKRDLRMRYVMVFKNHGSVAGASLEHPHSQLIALPIVPKNVSEEMKGALDYYNYKERCVFCDIVRQEVQEKSRLVYENGGFVAIEPYAPKFPFETWVLPRRHRSAFETTPQARVRQPGQRAARRAAQAPLRARRSALQLHPALGPFHRRGHALLSLAHRDHADADTRGRVRVGLGLLYQPHATRRGRRSSCAK